MSLNATASVVASALPRSGTARSQFPDAMSRAATAIVAERLARPPAEHESADQREHEDERTRRRGTALFSAIEELLRGPPGLQQDETDSDCRSPTSGQREHARDISRSAPAARGRSTETGPTVDAPAGAATARSSCRSPAPKLLRTGCTHHEIHFAVRRLCELRRHGVVERVADRQGAEHFLGESCGLDDEQEEPVVDRHDVSLRRPSRAATIIVRRLDAAALSAGHPGLPIHPPVGVGHDAELRPELPPVSIRHLVDAATRRPGGGCRSCTRERPAAP